MGREVYPVYGGSVACEILIITEMTFKLTII